MWLRRFGAYWISSMMTGGGLSLMNALSCSTVAVFAVVVQTHLALIFTALKLGWLIAFDLMWQVQTVIFVHQKLERDLHTACVLFIVVTVEVITAMNLIVLRMLGDERYIGTYVIGKQSMVEVGNSRTRKNPESPPLDNQR
ncbi:MAG: hypothetical protein LBU32_09385 [Clostridiales bacterium]|jgi:hypothetical protein|nr:hypothetical protein [Clostridiales bacterium]